MFPKKINGAENKMLKECQRLHKLNKIKYLRYAKRVIYIYIYIYINYFVFYYVYLNAACLKCCFIYSLDIGLHDGRCTVKLNPGLP